MAFYNSFCYNLHNNIFLGGGGGVNHIHLDLEQFHFPFLSAIVIKNFGNSGLDLHSWKDSKIREVVTIDYQYLVQLSIKLEPESFDI